MFKSCFLSLSFLLVWGCHSGKKDSTGSSTMQDTAKFYPIRQFLEGQLRQIDSGNFSFTLLTEKQGKKDTARIDKARFSQLADTILHRAAYYTDFKAAFKESAFRDLSTGSLIFNYTPFDKAFFIQHIDLLLDEPTQHIKRVFIRSLYNSGDTSILEQCSWKTNSSFQLSKFFELQDGRSFTENNIISWENKKSP
jgi:hypothetical protein